jgi:ATP-dependent protease ClpP protease subunit
MPNKQTEDQALPLLVPGDRKPYGAYTDSISLRQLHFYISGLIEEPEHYCEMVHEIRSASQNDVVHIHLNTPGGVVSTGVQIITAIENTEALVCTHAEGEVCSMGSLIFLAGHQMYAYQHSMLMFHNYSGAVVGKGHEQKAALDASERWYSRLMDTICTPFLSKSEIKKIKEGGDLYLMHEEIRDRLEKVQEYYEKRNTEEAAKAEELSEPKK